MNDEPNNPSAEQRELELAVERERIELLQRFMGDVSHDFKTPLTAIKLGLYLLKRAQTESDRERHMESIEKQVNRLEQLMADLFSMSRLDKSATNEFRFGRIQVNALVADMVSAHAAFIDQKQQHIHFEEGEIFLFMGDRVQIERAFSNLLMNAITYTPEGGRIIVRTYLRNRQLHVEFEDNGIGIDPDEQTRIFERFYRSDRARSSATGGMGLGLAIASKIIEAHGGTIHVESEPGKGSLFRVSFTATLSR